MRNDLLDIDVRLLILRYGRQKVVSSLARLVEQTPAALEEQLGTLEQVKNTTPKQASKHSLVELASLECVDHDETLEPLRALAVAYESRRFLPNLRDVHLFLDRTGKPNQKFKSREAAGSILIRTLSKMSNEELTQLASRYAEGGESDYALLSKAIMGETSDETGNSR